MMFNWLLSFSSYSDHMIVTWKLCRKLPVAWQPFLILQCESWVDNVITNFLFSTINNTFLNMKVKDSVFSYYTIRKGNNLMSSPHDNYSCNPMPYSLSFVTLMPLFGMWEMYISCWIRNSIIFQDIQIQIYQNYEKFNLAILCVKWRCMLSNCPGRNSLTAHTI